MDNFRSVVRVKTKEKSTIKSGREADILQKYKIKLAIKRVKKVIKIGWRREE